MEFVRGLCLITDGLVQTALISLAVWYVSEGEVLYSLVAIIAFSTYQISCTLGLIREQLTQGIK